MVVYNSAIKIHCEPEPSLKYKCICHLSFDIGSNLAIRSAQMDAFTGKGLNIKVILRYIFGSFNRGWSTGNLETYL